MAKCESCGGEAKYSVNNDRELCRDCLVEEFGLCVICANKDTCDMKDDGIVTDLCSEFEE